MHNRKKHNRTFLEPLNPEYCRPVKYVVEDQVDGCEFVFLSETKAEAEARLPVLKRKNIEPQQKTSQAKILQKLPASKHQKILTSESKKEHNKPVLRTTHTRTAKDKAKLAIYLTPIQYGHFKTPIAEPVCRPAITSKNTRNIP